MPSVSTTIEIPDDLLRRIKATAALRGESLKDFITDALRDCLDLQASRALDVVLADGEGLAG
jgi:predicted transcriptional regulator